MVLLSHKGKGLYLILVVESTFVAPVIVSFTGNSVTGHNDTPHRWDCSKYLNDRSGNRLLEELGRRTNMLLKERAQTVDGIAITLPGTIKENSVITRSTRLGIYDEINVSELFKRNNTPPCFVFHDTECLGKGEAIHGALKDINDINAKHNFAYVYVDEGVGSTLFIDGKAHKGNGSAGHLGRMVVDPSGQYNPTHSSRGSLEVFASRSWVSSNIVGLYLAEQDKLSQATVDQTFRSAVITASEKQETWGALTYEIIARGLKASDPIAVTAVDDAAKYLGFAINCIITIANPPAIVIGGGMIKNLPSLYENVVSYARRYSWSTAWNRTQVKRAILERTAQIYGAAEMLKIALSS